MTRKSASPAPDFIAEKNGSTLAPHGEEARPRADVRYDGASMIQVHVSVNPRPYSAIIADGLLAQAGELLRDHIPPSASLFVIAPAPVRRKWSKLLTAALTHAGFRCQVIEIADGERFKTLSTVEKLAGKLVSAGADRNAALVAFGGGVTGDITGFLASIYMRGIPVVQIPTTVLAQLDAAIGGKTGVNLKAGKNLVGTFHHPQVVLIDPGVLRSLPDRQFRAGLYEALKCGVIGSPALFHFFEENKQKLLHREPGPLEWVIAESVRLKASIVESDDREAGLRQVLNLGHTIGHAIEAETGFRAILHGEAVAWGMLAVTNIALSMARLDSVTAGRIADAVLGLGSLPKLNVEPRRILRRIQTDKKTANGVPHFVLPRDIGRVEMANDIPQSNIIAAVQELRRISGA
jgi:3-dehydroquinate synthase